ncbi:MAG: PIG-L family deacetylase [Phycisphaeraceae bacterium]|nr:PIG-L family deacetylase [Phycisphaerae bacterium]MBX3392345.1 PIG-L family deacetylase [Phycisphaeraceae bacterium]
MANVLVIGPHPDDQELGMGGTIARLAAQGHDVVLCDVTDGCPTPYGDRPTRLAEAAQAAAALCPTDQERSAGGKDVRRVLLDLRNREVIHTLEARHLVAAVIRAHQASVLFIPHPEDAHPDHLAVTRIAHDARFDAKLTGLRLPEIAGLGKAGPPIYARWCFHYYCSHLRRVPDPTFCIDTTGYADRKRRAVEAYQSQFAVNPANRGLPDLLGASDRYFGSRIGVESAEPFFSREVMGLDSFAGLVGIAR